MIFRIYGKFPSLNEYVNACRSNAYVVAKMKKEQTDRVYCEIKKKKVQEVQGVVSIRFQWFRKDMRTDPDNIAFGSKFILDGMVKAGIISNDGWKNISELRHFFYKETNDFVEVMINY